MYTLTLLALAAVALEVTARQPHFEPKRVGGVLAGAPVNNITVSASGVTQCAQATISWTGTSPPVTLSIGSGGFYVGTTPIATLPDLYDASTTWTVDAAAGTDLIFEVTDAEGAVGYVQNVQVGSSGDSSCFSSAASASASSASAYPSVSATSAPYVVSSGSASAAATASSSKKSKSSKSHSASSTLASISSTFSTAPGTTAVPSGSASAVGASTSAASGSSSTGTATLAAAGAGSSTGAGIRVEPGGIVAMVVAGLLASLM